MGVVEGGGVAVEGDGAEVVGGGVVEGGGAEVVGGGEVEGGGVVVVVGVVEGEAAGVCALVMAS